MFLITVTVGITKLAWIVALRRHPAMRCTSRKPSIGVLSAFGRFKLDWIKVEYAAACFDKLLKHFPRYS